MSISSGRKPLLLVALGVVGLGFAFVVSLLLYSEVSFRLREPDDVPFDASVWKSSGLGGDTRYRMTDSVIDSKVLVDLGKAGVVDILGEPIDPHSAIWKYTIGGPVRAFSGFANFLVVEFDDRDRVRDVRRYTN